MKIFELEKPVLDKIKTVVDKAIADGKIPAGQKILYLEYEPDEGFIYSADYDGTVAVYSNQMNFVSGSTTGTQETDSMLIVDCYGFGDPVRDGTNPLEIAPTVKEAQLRAQVLTTLAYKAIMDRQEIAGSLPTASPVVTKDFGTDIDTGDKIPVSIVKFSPQGTMETRRGAVIYRSTYNFRNTEEDVPSEPLGVNYVGSDDIKSDTYDPGSQPA